MSTKTDDANLIQPNCPHGPDQQLKPGICVEFTFNGVGLHNGQRVKGKVIHLVPVILDEFGGKIYFDEHCWASDLVITQQGEV